MKLKITYFAKEEINILLNDAFVKNKHHWILFKTLLETGLRISELCKLQKKDINFGDKSLYVIGKGNKYRIIKISPDFAMTLENYIQSNNITFGMRIFPKTRQAYHWIMRKYSKEFKVHPHKFRHTYAINCLRTTGNIRFLMSQMGHSLMDTSAQYLQFAEYDKEESKLGDLYG